MSSQDEGSPRASTYRAWLGKLCSIQQTKAIYTTRKPGLINPDRRPSPQQDAIQVWTLNQTYQRCLFPSSCAWYNNSHQWWCISYFSIAVSKYRDQGPYRRRGLFVPTVSVKVYYHHSKKQVGMGTGAEVEGSHPKLQAQSGKWTQKEYIFKLSSLPPMPHLF